MRRSKLAALGVLPFGLLLAPSAHADGGSISPGFLLSGVTGEQSYLGLGGELSFMYYAGDEVITEQIGLGGFLQAQTYDTSFGRYAAGAQAGSWFGGELGWAYREEGPAETAGHGLHLAGYASAGVFVASLRATVPLIGEDEPGKSAPGFELAFNLAIKIPIPIGDLDVVGPLPHGRPLRHGEQQILPELLLDGRPVRASDFSDERARTYADDARAERASVPAFLRLASELGARGAHSLARRALAAAGDEVRHARICLALASARSGTKLGLGPIALPPRRVPSLEDIAVESALDRDVLE